MYSEDIIEEVRSRNDIVDVVSSYVQLKRSGSNYFGLCPFHNEKSPSFSVNRPKQMFYCFGCHKGGNVYTFLMEYNNWEFPEALDELANRCGYQLPKQQMSKEEKLKQSKKVKLRNIMKDAANYYFSALHSNNGKAAMEYLVSNRDLDRDTIRSFALGYADGKWDSMYRFLKSKEYEDEIMKQSGLVVFHEKKGPRDYFINRLIFPIVDEKGRPIAFGGRVFDDSKPKYLNSNENEIFHKRNNFYGLDRAKRSRRNAYILCEGYMDVIALHKAGFDNAIAPLGTALTKEQVKKLKVDRDSKKVYICFDMDFAGTDAMQRAVGMLALCNVDAKVITLGEYKDPDEFIKANGSEAFEDRINKAENSFIFSLKKLREEYNVNDPEENNRFFRMMAGRLYVFPTEIERDNYVATLADEFNVSADSIRELMRDVAKNESELNRYKEGFFRGYTAKDFEEDSRQNDDIISESVYENNSKRLSTEKMSKRGIMETEGILLTWLLDEPALYNAVSKYIDAEDFTEGVARDTAAKMFASYEAGEEFQPAVLMNAFEDNEDHKRIAGILNTKIGELENNNDIEVLLKETLIKLKNEGLGRIDTSKPGAVKRIKKVKDDIRNIQSTSLL